MGEKELLGAFEQMVLLAVFRLGKEAYSEAVRREIEECTARSVSRGALYVTLRRLEEKGYLMSWFGDPTPERGGRAKKYFKIDAPGVMALRESQTAIRSLSQGLEPILGAI